jgi:hypothetical protein
MSMTKLIKLSPLVLMVAFLAYSGYSIHSSAVDPDAGPTTLAKDVDAIVQELRTVGNSIATAPGVSLRDPFQVVAKPVDKEAAADGKDAEPAEPATDTLADAVRSLRLDGTFVQGTQQIAIINGRIYTKGQHLVINGDPGKPVSQLFLVGVKPSTAILHADGRNFVLGYSDQITSSLDKARSSAAESPQKAMAEIDAGGQMAMFQKLLNSPLGALGKSVIGRGSGSRSRRPRTSAGNTAGLNSN